MVCRRRLITLAAAAVATALAACSSPPAHATAGQLVQLQVIERTHGGALPTYRQRGAAWVAGRPGERYALRLSNRTAGRVLVVLSVDGVNAITGETAGAAQSGYVLAPWQTAEITGWRKSDAEAAAFYFTALPDSYAARTDRPHNVGVIGAAVFQERVPMPRPYEPVPYSSGSPRMERPDGAGSEQRSQAPAPAATGRASADAAGASGAAAAEGARAERDRAPGAPALRERLGTGHGEREYAPITRTAFERATPRPVEIVQIRYDTEAHLVAAGIIPPRSQGPDAFPVPAAFPGYVPDPR